jgi:predicted nucleotidyltransferase component of viral defense system
MNAYDPMQYVELFHLLFLDMLGRKLDKRHYALKGGCNLRFFLKSFRYSEDMDLDIKAVPQEKLKEIVDRILDSKTTEQVLGVNGFRIESWSAPKQTGTTQRWKMALSASGVALPLHTKVEFSRRGMGADTLFEPVDAALIQTYRLAPVIASHYSAHAAYQQKIEATVTRSTPQARDIFDLSLLVRSGVDTRVSARLKKKLGQARANIMETGFGVFKSQVLSYLHPDYRAQYDSPSVWDDMRLEIDEALEGAK